MPVEVLGFDPNLEMTTQAALCSRWSSDLPFLSFFHFHVLNNICLLLVFNNFQLLLYIFFVLSTPCDHQYAMQYVDPLVPQHQNQNY